MFMFILFKTPVDVDVLVVSILVVSIYYFICEITVLDVLCHLRMEIYEINWCFNVFLAYVWWQWAFATIRHRKYMCYPCVVMSFVAGHCSEGTSLLGFRPDRRCHDG